MDRELKNLTLNISQLAALSGVHRQTAAARLQNLPVAGGHESNLKLYRVVDKQPDAFCRCSFLAGGARAGLYSHDQ